MSYEFLEILSRFDTAWLIQSKLLYFIINMHFFVLHMFRGNYAIDHFKISASQYGSILGTILLITFFTNILIAAMCDKFQMPKYCLMGLIALSCLFFQLFFFESWFKGSAWFFWSNLLLYLMFNNAIPALLDKITLDQISKRTDETSINYGRQRLWGTLGYLVANIIIERRISASSKSVDPTTLESVGSKFDFTGLKYYNFITTGLALILTYFSVNGAKSDETPTPNVNILDKLGVLIRCKRYLTFIIIILLNGITRSAMTMYLTIYFTDALKIVGDKNTHTSGILSIFVEMLKKNPLTTTALFGILLEIVILWNSVRLLARFGLLKPLVFAQVCQLMRFVFYLYLDPQSQYRLELVCVAELLKGCNFAFTQIASVKIAAKLCPSELKTTSQMIYSGTFTGFASFFAGIIFGSIFFDRDFDEVSSYSEHRVDSFTTMFRLNIIVSLFAIILVPIVYKSGTNFQSSESSVYLENKETESIVLEDIAVQ